MLFAVFDLKHEFANQCGEDNNLESFYVGRIYLYGRLISVVCNFGTYFLTTYRVSQMRKMPHVDAIDVLASRLKYYALVQGIFRIGPTWSEVLHRNVFVPEMLLSIFSPGTDIGYFIVFLLMQPGAMKLMRKWIKDMCIQCGCKRKPVVINWGLGHEIVNFSSIDSAVSEEPLLQAAAAGAARAGGADGDGGGDGALTDDVNANARIDSAAPSTSSGCVRHQSLSTDDEIEDEDEEEEEMRMGDRSSLLLPDDLDEDDLMEEVARLTSADYFAHGHYYDRV